MLKIDDNGQREWAHRYNMAPVGNNFEMFIGVERLSNNDYIMVGQEIMEQRIIKADNIKVVFLAVVDF